MRGAMAADPQRERGFRVQRFEDRNVRLYKTITLRPPPGRLHLNYSARTASELALDALPTREVCHICVSYACLPYICVPYVTCVRYVCPWYEGLTRVHMCVSYMCRTCGPSACVFHLFPICFPCTRPLHVWLALVGRAGGPHRGPPLPP